MNREKQLMKRFPLEDGTTYIQSLDKHLKVKRNYPQSESRIQRLEGIGVVMRILAFGLLSIMGRGYTILMDVDMELNRCGITNLLCPSKRKQTLHSTQCILVGSRGNRYLQFTLIKR
jgi:hypothetical protein